MMEFDLYKHKVNMILIRCGEKFIEAKILPPEKDVTKLVKMVGDLIGVHPEALISRRDGGHLPRPDETGPFFKCPKCNEKKLVIYDICSSCKDSEGGKFKTELKCSCGYQKKTEKFRIQLYKEFEYDFNSGMKADLGIKTITDEGVK